MYRQILVTPEHRKYVHIFWRASPDDGIGKRELNTVIYGTASSAFQANRVIKQLAHDEGADFPLAAEVLERDIYVDDVASGAGSVEDALELKRQLISLLGRGRFTIHKWNSNHLDVVQDPEDPQQRRTVELSPHSDPCVTTILGMVWDPVQDCFTYSVRPIPLTVTKRSISSTIARLYDPLGFLVPVILRAKLFLQLL